MSGKALMTLEDLDPKAVNLLVPTTAVQQVSPFHKATVTLIQASPNRQDGDVYKQGTVKVGDGFVEVFSPSKTLLEKFAKASGITWDPHQSSPVTPSVCQKCQASHRAVGKPTPCVGCPHEYDVAHRAVGGIQTPTGQFLIKDAIYELDFVSLEEELLSNAEEKASRIKKAGDRPTPEMIAAQVKKAIIQKKRHRVALAETGAQDRVIRKLLTTKSTYTAAELAKPFAVQQIGFSPDMSDPETRRIFVTAAAKAQMDVFGSQREINVTPSEAQQASEVADAMRGVSGPTPDQPDTRPVPPEPAPESVDEPADNAVLMEFDGEFSEPSMPSEEEMREVGSRPMPVEGRDYIVCENPDCPAPVIEIVAGWTAQQMAEYLKGQYGRVLCRACRPRRENTQSQQAELPT